MFYRDSIHLLVLLPGFNSFTGIVTGIRFITHFIKK